MAPTCKTQDGWHQQADILFSKTHNVIQRYAGNGNGNCNVLDSEDMVVNKSIESWNKTFESGYQYSVPDGQQTACIGFYTNRDQPMDLCFQNACVDNVGWTKEYKEKDTVSRRVRDLNEDQVLVEGRVSGAEQNTKGGVLGRSRPCNWSREDDIFQSQCLAYDEVIAQRMNNPYYQFKSLVPVL